ncbi:PaaI family thioesterase [Methylobacterium platani]|uniref:Medium/long-chain acyl-CoA thioesterase YigI n=2 Tax=Methylobacterium platani TaxID=427683 RepID=A0A179S9Z8_9HYPH|nr:PaaI family thioesterase [Methylobacterium platani]KMO16894.1 thioesterase [Methylobacterium platani JCM 14648]OAS24416.1 thioesterase [Methylobacterium platani]
MTAPFDPAAAGWETVDMSEFMDLIGPVWQRADAAGLLHGLVVEGKHRNRNGVVHGGVMATLLDMALGRVAAEAQGGRRQATISLDLQFLAPVETGEFLVAEGRVVRATRSILFMQGTLRVEDRVCAVGQGVWKILGT